VRVCHTFRLNFTSSINSIWFSSYRTANAFTTPQQQQQHQQQQQQLAVDVVYEATLLVDVLDRYAAYLCCMNLLNGCSASM